MIGIETEDCVLTTFKKLNTGGKLPKSVKTIISNANIGCDLFQKSPKMKMRKNLMKIQLKNQVWKMNQKMN